MAIKTKEITKSDSVNAVGNIIFSFNIVDEKGVVIASETSTMSVNFNNVDMKDIAESLMCNLHRLKDAENREYALIQKAKVDKFDVVELKAEIDKQIAEKASIEAVKP